MGKENFDSLVGQFQQCESLDRYVEIMNALGTIDEQFAERVRRVNYMVFAIFTAAGREGFDFLINKLDTGDKKIRQSCTHIILEIGRNLKGVYREIAIEVLKNRQELEKDKDIIQRVVYCLEQLGVRRKGAVSDIDFQVMS